MSKQAYEPPVIVRHRPGLMNKLSRVRAMRPLTHIEGVPVADLVAQYGSPLFVFSEKILSARYRELRDTFSLRHPRTRIAWSFKTNYLDGVCRIFQREGAFAEVVSQFEYEKAIRLGYAPGQIHFNGPYKPEPVLERALREGAHVHLDNFDELSLAEKIAGKHDLRPKVAVRINLTAPTVPEWARFGFNLESGQARDAVTRLVAGKTLELEGLHCHMGTFILEPDAYRYTASALARFANEIRDRHGITLSFLDLGGGFASPNTLKAQYLPGEQAAPSFARYAEAVSDGLSELDYPGDKQPTLVLETGRALVDEAGTLVATVQANKRLPDGRRALVVDSGVNILFTSFWYKHDVVPCQEFRGTYEPTVLYGPLCMNIDEVRETLLFPPMKPGDRVAFRNVGAYNVTQWMQFITYRPAVVLVGPDRRHALLRRAENLDSVVAMEEMPKWL